MKKLFVALLVCLGLLMPATPRVEAIAYGYYAPVGADNCMSTAVAWPAFETYICVDISDQSLRIVSPIQPDGWRADVYYVTVPFSASQGAYPTRGWIVPDANCNSINTQFGWIMSFQVGSGYNLNSKTVNIQQLYFGASNPSPWWVTLVSQAATQQLAWVANSNTGYECIVLP